MQTEPLVNRYSLNDLKQATASLNFWSHEVYNNRGLVLALQGRTEESSQVHTHKHDEVIYILEEIMGSITGLTPQGFLGICC